MSMFKRIKYIYGPHIRKKDGRKFISIVYNDGRKRFVSYPKFLVETVLKYELHPTLETIDHINRDYNDNRWDNLRIIDMATHAKEDAQKALDIVLECYWCQTKFKRNPAEHNSQVNRGAKGNFCSRKCGGSYSANVQYGNITPFPFPKKVPKTKWKYNKLKNVGPTVQDIARQRGLTLPTEGAIVAAFPKRGFVKKVVYICKQCSEPITGTGTKYCSNKCKGKGQRKVARPDKEVLTALLKKHTLVAIGKKFNVSDSAVRKWCKNYGIKHYKRNARDGN